MTRPDYGVVPGPSAVSITLTETVSLGVCPRCGTPRWPASLANVSPLWRCPCAPGEAPPLPAASAPASAAPWPWEV